VNAGKGQDRDECREPHLCSRMSPLAREHKRRSGPAEPRR
jgi:hypothetical protein